MRKYLIKNNKKYHGVNQDLHIEFENTILTKGNWDYKTSTLSERFYRLFQVIDEYFHLIWKPFTPDSNLVQFATSIYLVSYFPYFNFKAKLKTVWMYDAWESTWDNILKKIKIYDINIIFFSSRHVTEHFKSLNLPNLEAHWLPEAVNVAEYSFEPYSNKSIDVLQYGRAYNAIHQLIEPVLKNRNANYIHTKHSTHLIFDTKKDLVIGLSKAKISLCFPTTITHPNKSSKVETATWRYFQAFASKCLIVGKAPEELIELFGYNPVIEIDLKNAAEKINLILDNYDTYIPLIEKNYSITVNFHQWENRINRITEIIDAKLLQ